MRRQGKGGGQEVEDQREEDKRRRSTGTLKSARQLDFPFSGVARLAEPGTCPNRADCPIESVLWLSQAGASS